MQSFCAHLTAYQSQVRAGLEITAGMTGWSFLRVCAGRGYLLNEKGHAEIETGDVVIIPAASKVSLRASQLGDMRLCHFGVRAEQLVGFFTAKERQLLDKGPLKITHLARVIKRDDPVAQQHAELCNLRQLEPGVLVRSAMLSVAVRALRDILSQATNHQPRPSGPEQKFNELMAQIPESELLSSPIEELARQCGCTDRHFRRLFGRHFGTSLKQRQIEWRIERAKKLLLESDAKIIDIAGRCGFRSLGQFNLTFKNLTRMTPGQWRRTYSTTKLKHRRQHPPLCPRPSSSRAHHAGGRAGSGVH